MRIGIDARLLSRPLTGIGRYTVEACRALSQRNDVSLYLYSPAPLIHEVSPAIIKTGSIQNVLARQAWAEVILPRWANRDALDLFWGPAHRIPRGLARRIATVVTIHDLVWKYAGNTMRPLSRLMENYQLPSALKRADHVVAVSEATATSLQNDYPFSANKLTAILSGADHLKGTPDKQNLKKMGINRPYFLFVGTLEPRKNLHSLLKAYAALPGSVRERASLFIAGGQGWGNVKINELIAALNLTQDVKLLGYVDEDTLATLYANARFVAMPSLYEGFGLPLVEAMSYGTPVLTSNNSSMCEIASQGSVLVDPLDITAISQGLSQLILDDVLQAKLAREAQEHSQQFTWERTAEQLVRVFEKALESKRQGGP